MASAVNAICQPLSWDFRNLGDNSSARNESAHETRYALSSSVLFRRPTEAHLLIHNLRTLPHPTPDPHPTINLVPIPLITSLHLNEQSELIAIRINIISLCRVSQLSQHFRRTCSPSVRLDDNMGWRIVVGLEDVVRFQVRGTIAYDDLAVLTAGLVAVSTLHHGFEGGDVQE